MTPTEFGRMCAKWRVDERRSESRALLIGTCAAIGLPLGFVVFVLIAWCLQ